MKILITLAAFTICNTLQAASIQMNFSYFVGVNKDLSRTFISTTPDGRFKIYTHSGSDTIVARVISDERETDGELHLDLTKGRTLIVTTALSSDARVRYFLKSKLEEIELSPVVSLHIKPE